MTKDKALTGAAGEYYVAFRLTAMGYAVGLTPRGTASIDLIVANPNTGKSITIQTKTMGIAFGQSRNGASYWKWRAGKPRPPHKTFFYAFVDLKDDLSQAPDVFIIPSGELTPPLLDIYPKIGEPKDFWCVIEEEDAPKYRNRWNRIEDALKQSS
jgi:hypothetical protein